MDETTTIEAPEAPESFEGQDPVREAATERAKQLSERGPPAHSLEQPDRHLDDEVIEVRYTDGRPADQPLNIREAARDVAAYRQAQREQEQQTLNDLLGEEQPKTAETVEQAPVERTETPAEVPHVPQPAQAEEFVQQVRATAAHEFSDIRTPDDVARLAATDPARHARWQQLDFACRVGQGAALEQQITTAFKTFAAEQDKLTVERIPELRDPQARAEFSERALETLDSHGFKREELRAGYNGQAGFSLRDARVQQVIADATRWRLAQAKRHEATKMPVPPVQRPGVGGTIRNATDLDQLSSRLSKTGKLSDAVRMRVAQRQSNRG